LAVEILSLYCACFEFPFLVFVRLGCVVCQKVLCGGCCCGLFLVLLILVPYLVGQKYFAEHQERRSDDIGVDGGPMRVLGQICSLFNLIVKN
jgi:hypothetical protein